MSTMAEKDVCPLEMTPEGQEALEDFLQCYEGFTGNYSIDFQDGEPKVRKRSDTLRFTGEGGKSS